MEFLKSKGEKAGAGFWSEQAMESAHHDFKEEMAAEMLNYDCPNFVDKLLRVVVRYNGKHI